MFMLHTSPPVQKAMRSLESQAASVSLFVDVVSCFWRKNLEQKKVCLWGNKKDKGLILPWEEKSEGGHSGAKRKKKKKSERKERKVLERKSLRRGGFRLGILDFLKKSRAILYSKELNINQ